MDTAAARQSHRSASTGGFRRWRTVAVALLVAVVCAGLCVGLVMSVSGRDKVLIAAADIDAGQAVTASRVSVTEVAADSSVHLIAAADSSAVAGKVAAGRIAKGTLLTREMLAKSEALSADQVKTSLALKPGQYPADVAAGASVAVFTAAGAEATAADKTGDAGASRVDAVVVSVDVAEEGCVMTIQLAQADAAVLAGADRDGLSVMTVAGE